MFKLATYKDKRLLRFSEVPYDIKVLVINKCMEQNAGPFYLIQDFRNMKTQLGLNPNEGEPDSDDDLNEDSLLDKDTTFVFHSHASGRPPAGKGSGEKIPDAKLHEFNLLNKERDWRKKLDDSWPAPFMIDKKRWSTVEHYLLGAQYKKGFPDFYHQFSLDSGTDFAKDLALAKIAGGKTGKTKDRVLRESKVKVDPDFFGLGVNPRHVEERRIALHAKFTQNMDLLKMLKETKQAKLVKFVRGRRGEPDEQLMKLRKDLLNN